MPTIPISDAKARLAALVREVAATGEGYVISVNGRPVAELRPFVPVPTPGRFKDSIVVHDDSFAPLTDTEAAEWGL
jgi:prevent-host-death family protein